MEALLKNEKVKLIFKIVMISVGIYLAFRFIMPFIWPIVIGYLIAKLIYPVVEFLNKKGQFDRNLATVLTLGVFVIVSFVVGFFLVKMLFSQVQRLGQNWNDIMEQMDCQVKNICCGFEKGLKMEDGKIYLLVSDGFQHCLKTGKEKVLSLLMTGSVSAFIKMIECLAVIFVIVMSAFFFIKDEKRIHQWISTYPFAEETKFISDKLKFVLKAYLRAQFIIMLGTSGLCFVGLTIIQNPYSLLLAIVLGILDALPLIGLGLVLVPWAVICLIWGKAKNGIVLMITFVLCYILREILEPKLIGTRVGIPPLTSLITIYAGYKLFGLVGVVLGPVAYIIIRESVQMTE